MNFPSKPDWEACKARYAAWWQHEDIGRAGICVTAPKRPNAPMAPLPATVEARWTDWDYLSERMTRQIENTYYGGEAFPIWQMGYPGWDALPVFLGCDVELAEDTGWWHPFMEKGELCSYRPEALTIQRESRWFRLSQDYLRRVEQASRGVAIPTTGAFGGGGDTLAALRGTQELLIDVKDDPDAVLKFEMRMMDVWIEHYTERHEILARSREGAAGWFDLWAPGRFYAAQCDFSHMISTSDFERCFLPAIDRQVSFLDYSVYHVDGTGAFRHVDALCSLPRLNALQILPGAGKPSPLHYPEVLKKVQAAGKNLHITIPPEEVALALSLLDARGLMINTWTASEQQAKDLLALVERR